MGDRRTAGEVRVAKTPPSRVKTAQASEVVASKCASAPPSEADAKTIGVLWGVYTPHPFTALEVSDSGSYSFA